MSHHDLIVLFGEVAVGAGALGTLGYYLARNAFNKSAGLKRKPNLVVVPSAAEAQVAIPVPPTDARPEGVPAAGKSNAATSAPGVASKSDAATSAAEVGGKAGASAKSATPPPRPSLAQTLRGTRESFWGRIQRGMLGNAIPDSQLEVIEEILYTSDLGPTTVQRLLEKVQSQLSRAEKQSMDAVKTSLKNEVRLILDGTPKMGQNPFAHADGSKPQVWMIVGVNGAGKTTTIGKLAHLAARENLRVLVAAGDTFRAAAKEQLKVWSERAQVEIFSPEGVTDPGAVAYDAVQMARARGYDLVLIDTAGRLHTQDNLMEELKKVKRVIQKIDPNAPHETLIVLDANSGQNALIQAEKFNEAVAISGAVFTKMDGTAKGGVVLGLAAQLEIPTFYLGIGESMDALSGFSPTEYADALFEGR